MGVLTNILINNENLQISKIKYILYCWMFCKKEASNQSEKHFMKLKWYEETLVAGTGSSLWGGVGGKTYIPDLHHGILMQVTQFRWERDLNYIWGLLMIY